MTTCRLIIPYGRHENIVSISAKNYNNIVSISSLIPIKYLNYIDKI